MRVYVPWGLPVYQGLNGFIEGRGMHPMLAPVPYCRMDGVEFVVEDPAKVGFNPDAVEIASAAATGLGIEYTIAFSNHPIVQLQDVFEFLRSRDFKSQGMAQLDVDLSFFHTTPLTLNQTPWVLHIENPTTLFWPELWHGRCGGVRLKQQPIYWIIKTLLASDHCRGIYTHMARTRDGVHRIFDDDVISSKVEYFPIGLEYPPAGLKEIAEEGLASCEVGDEVTILFTNSWHQDIENFYLRGGHDLVDSFIEVENACPQARLILRSQIPDDLDPRLKHYIRNNPNIEVIDEFVSDEKLVELYAKSAIFALPSMGLHTASVLRAMSLGKAVIASDAPGLEELIDHGDTGILVEGRINSSVYSVDTESGWLRDDFTRASEPDRQFQERLTRSLIELCQSHDLRRRLGKQAQEVTRTRNDFGLWIERMAEFFAAANPAADRRDPRGMSARAS